MTEPQVEELFSCGCKLSDIQCVFCKEGYTIFFNSFEYLPVLTGLSMYSYKKLKCVLDILMSERSVKCPKTVYSNSNGMICGTCKVVCITKLLYNNVNPLLQSMLELSEPERLTPKH